MAEPPPAISLQGKHQAMGWRQTLVSTQCPFWAVTLLLLPPRWGREVVHTNAVSEGDVYLCGEMHMPWDGAAALVKFPHEAARVEGFLFPLSWR